MTISVAICCGCRAPAVLWSGMCSVWRDGGAGHGVRINSEFAVVTAVFVGACGVDRSLRYLTTACAASRKSMWGDPW